MKYIYPAIFSNEEDNVLVSVPDLPGLHTFGKDLADALYMAQDAIEMWLWDAENKNEYIPPPSSINQISERCSDNKQFVNFIIADTDEYRRQNETKIENQTFLLPA